MISRISVLSVWIIAASLISSFQLADAAELIVELRPQKVSAIRGVIVYPNGKPVEGALVVELTSDWKTELRRTETDSAGRFELAPVEGRKIYYLQIAARESGVNLLRVPVQMSRWSHKRSLRLRLQLA